MPSPWSRWMAAMIVLVVLPGAILLLPEEVSAHALLQSSDPVTGARLAASPAVVTITFGEEPDPKVSRIAVLDTAGGHHESGHSAAVPGNPLALAVRLSSLPKGIYTVSWRTLSVIDGHSAAGTYAFGVQLTPDQSPASAATTGSATSAVTPLSVAGRTLLFAGLVITLGSAFIGVLTPASLPVAALTLLATGWVMSVAGVACITTAQLQDAGLGWGELGNSSLLHTFTNRVVTAAGGGIALLVVLLSGRARRAALAVAGVAAAASMLADVAASHAAAQGDRPLNVVVQWLHILAVGIWVGGLAALLVVVRRLSPVARPVLIHRFSTAAGVCLGVVAATGVIRATVEIGTWAQLLATTFGLLVILKAALILILAGLGAINRWRNVRLAVHSIRGLGWTGRTELFFAAMALVAAATLVNVAPPRSVAAALPAALPAAPPLVAGGADYATTVRVRLEISPGEAGFNRFNAIVSDYDSGAPVPDATLELHFAFGGTSDVGESVLQLSPEGSGRFAGEGANLSLDGTWTVTVLVERGARSVEVPIELTTRTVPPQVDISRTPGLPTLYTIHLTSGGTVQVYADPDRPGPVTFHTTFFDSNGGELAVRGAAVAVTPAGGHPSGLDLRQLEPGHFVASVTLPAGRSGIDITATAPTGGHLATHLDLIPGG